MKLGIKNPLGFTKTRVFYFNYVELERSSRLFCSFTGQCLAAFVNDRVGEKTEKRLVIYRKTTIIGIVHLNS